MHWLENWLLPAKCVLTGESGSGVDLAPRLVEALKEPGNVCPQCCEPSLDNRLCGACISTPPAFDRTQVGFYFENEMIELVHALKYGKQAAYGRLLAELMQARLDSSKVSALVAVPIHPLRWRERGFNQAQLIAESLAELFDLPLLTGAVSRVKQTSTQTGLTALQRRTNLQGAFEVNAELLAGYSAIALVDDVITTGATMNSLAARVKREAGMAYIEAWAIAKTK